MGESNGTDTKRSDKERETTRKFSDLVDATSTLLKETFPFGYRFIQKLKEKNEYNKTK